MTLCPVSLSARCSRIASPAERPTSSGVRLPAALMLAVRPEYLPECVPECVPERVWEWTGRAGTGLYVVAAILRCVFAASVAWALVAWAPCALAVVANASATAMSAALCMRESADNRELLQCTSVRLLHRVSMRMRVRLIIRRARRSFRSTPAAASLNPTQPVLIR